MGLKGEFVQLLDRKIKVWLLIVFSASFAILYMDLFLVRKHRIRNSNFDGGSFFVLNYVARSPFTDMSFENYGEHL